ncbi:hypothetical protein GCM10027053_05390 [Intrasporangium mesophilum]
MSAASEPNPFREAAAWHAWRRALDEQELAEAIVLGRLRVAASDPHTFPVRPGRKTTAVTWRR